MSHLKERGEKICLNCNAQIYGRYCHVCGQENLEPKESFWHLVTHFVYDVTHFDGKFFSTLKYLLFKPGYLATEYLKGKRTNYLHPIRMYVFASAIFFIIFLGFIVKPEDIGKAVSAKENEGFEFTKQSLQDSIYSTTDTAKKQRFAKVLMDLDDVTAKFDDVKDTGKQKSAGVYRYKYNDSGRSLKANQKPANAKKDNDDIDPDYNINNNSNVHFTFTGDTLPKTVAQYDSNQSKLPAVKRDGWFKRLVIRRSIEINQKYHGDRGAFLSSFMETFFHSIPKMMFVSVPFVALVFQLLYIRRRKQFFYVNHVIFIIYVYIATFISLLVYFGFQALYNATNFALFSWLEAFTVIGMFLYCYLAMHNFYKQGWVKTFFKFFILLFVCSILSVFIISAFALTSLMEV